MARQRVHNRRAGRGSSGKFLPLSIYGGIIMNEARIIEIFAQMAGISRETALEQTPLAIMAEDKIKGRLREDYDGSNETLLTYVAASLVNLWYSHSRASGSPTGSFSGNGISISSDGQAGVEAAKNLYETKPCRCDSSPDP